MVHTQSFNANTLTSHSTDTAVYPYQAPAAPRTLVDILEASTAAHAKAIAIDDGRTRLSYAQLSLEVAARAEKLRSAHIGPGDRVGVRAASGSTDLYLSILAVLTAGAAYVPVDVDDPDDRAELVWEEAGVCAVLTDNAKLTAKATRGRGSPHRPGLEDDAWIIFTSGSTGKPKGVAVTHRSAAAFVDAESKIFLPKRPIAPGDRILAGLSVAFDASCEEMWLAWRYGACLVPAPRSLVKAGADLGDFLAAQRISVVSTVPTLAALWPAEALRQVRLLILGGEACPPELADRLADNVESVWNTYGPTEATVVACAAPIQSGQPVRIGLPLLGWKLAVVDTADQPVKWGETGQLVIGGVGLARYLDKVKDAAKFAPLPSLGWDRAYRSGDLVRADPDGLFFVARDDEQVKLGGRRVELGEIDAALMSLPSVSAAASAVRRSETGTPILVGYVVSYRPTGAADRALLQSRLPAALVPMLVSVSSLPIRTSGKVDRAALPWPPPQAEAHALHGTAGWIAEQWRKVLGMPAQLETNFFELGGTSLAAAQLVSLLRGRYPGLSVVDVYQHPTLQAMAARAEQLVRVTHATRIVLPTPRWAGLLQLPFVMGLLTFDGARFIIVLGLAVKLANAMGDGPWTVPLPLSWWKLITAWLVLISLPGRLLVTALGVRIFTAGISPGSYHRGGWTHLRLWMAERFVAVGKIDSITGTQWCRRYARLLGCRVGTNVQLHALPPVTGLAAFDSGCAIEPEVDIAGTWLDGDILHIGNVTIGSGARVGSRTIVMPNTVVQPFADVQSGIAISGVVDGDGDAPAVKGVSEKESSWTQVRYTLTLLFLEAVPILALAPATVAGLLILSQFSSLKEALLVLLVLAVPCTVLSVLCYASIVIAVVRVVSRYVYPGIYSWHGVEAWAAWLTHRLMLDTRAVLFGLFASLLTPAWLRMLGARVGRRVEASTVVVPPVLLQVDDLAFLADDVLLSPYDLWAGQLKLGNSSVGSRAFVGNSAIVGPDHAVPSDSLIGVLGTAPSPANMRPGSSWLGRPAMSLPRRNEAPLDSSRTFDPPTRLVVARAVIEACRLAPLVFSYLIAAAVLASLILVMTVVGFGWAVAVSGIVLLLAGLVACAIAVAAKWLLTPSIEGGQQHPLWSSFVWRNELADTFVESLAVPWLIRLTYGTPLLPIWLRSLGAKIGAGVWCDSHKFPEAELVELGAGVSVNRGCVLQTHLFHDRLMRLDTVCLEQGATLGPYAIALPNTIVGSGTVIGPASLVLRGERIPGSARWLGNPVQPWVGDDSEVGLPASTGSTLV